MATDASVEATAPQDDTDPRGEHVTIDQIVAHNIRHWRRKASMTQEELGNLLGWSAANVSAAERSADPDRERRRFDAQTLTELSLALSVPLVALFLPPVDEAGLTFTGPVIAEEDRGGDGCGRYDMGDLMELVVMTDSEDYSPVMEAYRQRFRAATGRYLDPEWAADVASWLRKIEPHELLTERIDRLIGDGDDLERIAATLKALAQAVDHAAGGPAHLPPPEP